MYMRLKKFQSLSNTQQVALLYKQGVYIGKRKSGKKTVLLYQLDSFYVEVFYLSYRRYIYNMSYSESIEILDPYLEQINVEYLVS
jgi:hypothetical protein